MVMTTQRQKGQDTRSKKRQLSPKVEVTLYESMGKSPAAMDTDGEKIK